MKKVFLFLTATVFGVAAMANGGWTHEKLSGAQTIQLLYNEYGDEDNGSGEIAHSWQGGNQGIINDAVEAYDEEGFDSWLLALNQQFSLKVKGTCSATGTFKTGIVDEQADAGYWFQNSAFASPEVPVTAGEEFEATFVYTITALASKNFDAVTVDKPALIFGLGMPDYAAATAYNDGTAPSEDVSGVKKVEFNFTVFQFEYMGDLSQYTKPYAMTNNGPDVDGKTKYQTIIDLTYDQKATTADFFNFSIKGVATQDIATLMVALWDGSAKASPKPYATSLCEEGGDGMATIKANIAKGQSFEVKGSLPIKLDVAHEDEFRYQVVFMGLSEFEGAQIVMDLKDADAFEIGTNKGYGIPQVAVEEIAAEDAIVNGVIYSEGAIVIYNQAGQKVAAASQEFAIASLGAGIYFAQTAEGSFSFVVK
ncbi:MAG: hypothetical protein J6W37_00275 [Bacteroidales bacterium]|nr:hypothetical protein [Bacteroidales bacterium]